MPAFDLMRMNPFDDRFARAFFGRPLRAFDDPMMAPEALALDVFRKDGQLMVKAALPGVEENDVKITVHDDVLTIVAERKDEKEVKEKDYYLKEYTTGTMQRSVRLPANLRVDQATASFDKGMLTVCFPENAAQQPKPVEIKVQPMV